MKSRAVLLTVVAIAASLCLGCSRTQPVANPPSPPAVPQADPIAQPTAEPPQDDSAQDLQQLLARALIPTFDFPDVDGFERGEIHNFEDPKQGYSFPYDSRTPKITATVYVYNRGLSEITDEIAKSKLKDEVDEVEQALPEMVRRGYYTSYTRLGDGERDFGSKKALWRSFEIGHTDGTLASDVYVTATRNCFIKVRCTYAADCGEVCENKITSLIARLGEMVDAKKVAE